MRNLSSLVALLVCMPVFAAEVPSLVNYQGRLLDDGVPAEGAYDLVFRMFDDLSAAAGAPCGDAASRCVWEETQSARVQVTGGTFNVLLGAVSPLDESLFSDPDRWLEVQVGGEVMEPRQRIASAAYAMKCIDCGAGSAGCPPDTTPVGAWCIDKFRRPVQNFSAATLTCHNEGRSICSVEALMVCDVTNPATSNCATDTDSPATRLWTSNSDAAFDTRVFQGLAVYGGDDIVRQGNAGDFYPFFCCETNK